MISILRDSPLLLLFVIAAIGWPLGRIQIGGVRLGVAAVLAHVSAHENPFASERGEHGGEVAVVFLFEQTRA